MRIDELRVHGFGPHNGLSFALQDGLNVVWGPNESGKSSLVQALVAGLVGRRKGRGKSLEEQAFKEHFRPWSDNPWLVELELTLADGRRIRITQDLDDPSNSKVIDSRTRKSVRTEIENDGAPDASRWLGLDRSNFSATAVVSQGDVAKVMAKDAVTSLGSALQRAATSLPTDSTAEEAIDRIKTFRTDHIGSDRRGTTKPMAVASAELEGARTRLTGAERAQRDHRDLVARFEDARVRQTTLEHEVRAWQLDEAQAELESLGRKIASARVLSDKISSLPGSVTGAARIDEVTNAIAAFRSIDSTPPAARRPVGLIQAEIEAEQAHEVDVPHVSEAINNCADRLTNALTDHVRFRRDPAPSVPPDPARKVDEVDIEIARRNTAIIETTHAGTDESAAGPAEVNIARARLRNAEQQERDLRRRPAPAVTPAPLRPSSVVLDDLNAVERSDPRLTERPPPLRNAEQAWSDARTVFDRVRSAQSTALRPQPHRSIQDIDSEIATLGNTTMSGERELSERLLAQRDAVAAARRCAEDILVERPSAKLPAPGSTTGELDALISECEFLTARDSKSQLTNTEGRPSLLMLAMVALGVVVVAAAAFVAVGPAGAATAGVVLIAAGLAVLRSHSSKPVAARFADSRASDFEGRVRALGIDPDLRALTQARQHAAAAEHGERARVAWKTAALDASSAVENTEMALSAELDRLAAPRRSDPLERFEAFRDQAREQARDENAKEQRRASLTTDRMTLAKEWSAWTTEARAAEARDDQIRTAHEKLEAAEHLLIGELGKLGISETTIDQALLTLERLLAKHRVITEDEQRRHDLLVSELETTRQNESRRQRELETAVQWEKELRGVRDAHLAAQGHLKHGLRELGFANESLEDATASFEAAQNEAQVNRTVDADRLAALGRDRAAVVEEWHRYAEAQAVRTDWERIDSAFLESTDEIALELRGHLDCFRAYLPVLSTEAKDATALLDRHQSLLRAVELRGHQHQQRQAGLQRLRAELETAAQAETERSRWQARVDIASAELRRLVAEVVLIQGSAAITDEECIEGLSAWRDQVRLETEMSAERGSAEGELHGLLQGATVEELQDRHASQAELVQGRKILVDAGLQREFTSPGDAESAFRLQQRRLAEIKGQCDQNEIALPSVAEAEEVVQKADERVGDLRELERVLDFASVALEKARAETHASLAPVLGNALGELVQRVTAGRYVGASVDVSTLQVSLETFERNSVRLNLLSYGTIEQVYLLLRMVLTDRLVKPGECSPMLFDEVLASSDETRSTAILEILRGAAAGSRQIIVFGHEQRLIDWAEENIADDHIIRLSAVS